VPVFLNRIKLILNKIAWPVIRIFTQVGPLLTGKTEIPRVSRKNVVSSSPQVVSFNDAVIC
jgi:hypothetical protein